MHDIIIPTKYMCHVQDIKKSNWIFAHIDFLVISHDTEMLHAE